LPASDYWSKQAYRALYNLEAQRLAVGNLLVQLRMAGREPLPGSKTNESEAQNTDKAGRGEQAKALRTSSKEAHDAGVSLVRVGVPLASRTRRMLLLLPSRS